MAQAPGCFCPPEQSSEKPPTGLLSFTYLPKSLLSRGYTETVHLPIRSSLYHQLRLGSFATSRYPSGGRIQCWPHSRLLLCLGVPQATGQPLSPQPVTVVAEELAMLISLQVFGGSVVRLIHTCLSLRAHWDWSPQWDSVPSIDEGFFVGHTHANLCQGRHLLRVSAARLQTSSNQGGRREIGLHDSQTLSRSFGGMDAQLIPRCWVDGLGWTANNSSRKKDPEERTWLFLGTCNPLWQCSRVNLFGWCLWKLSIL